MTTSAKSGMFTRPAASTAARKSVRGVRRATRLSNDQTRWTAVLAGLAAVGVVAWADARRSFVFAADAAPPAGGAPATASDTRPASAEAQDASLSLAQRFETAAYQLVQQGDRPKHEASWRESVAFLEAAEQLNPSEARYPRLRYFALDNLKDYSGAVAALEKYVALKPNDDVARLRLVEYYTSKMQTTDARLAYLTSLLEKKQVSDQIKSRAAVWAAGYLGERSLSKQREMIARAVALDPYNIYARELEYRQILADKGGPLDRMKSLVARLKCNPAQVEVLASIGNELANAGLVLKSAEWLSTALSLSQRSDSRISPDILVQFAAQAYLSGATLQADETIGSILNGDPSNLDAWFLRLTVRKSQNVQVAFDRELDVVAQVLAARAGQLAREIREEDEAKHGGATTRPSSPTTNPSGPTIAGQGGGDAGPTSKPFDLSAAFSPDGNAGETPTAAASPKVSRERAPTGELLGQTIARLKRPDAEPYYQREFTRALIDLAWFEVYYNRSSAAAKTWVDAVAELVPNDSVTVIRLKGWLELLNNRQREAMQLLWPLRAKDPQAGMGVVQLLRGSNWAPARPAGAAATQPAAKPPEYDPNVLAQKLLNQYPSGVLGAMLSENFSEMKIKPAPQSWADDLDKVLSTFEQDFLHVVDQPERFYTPKGEAQKLPYRLGEPMVADVSIVNRSNFALTIGDKGVIKPDLWFDARVTLGVDKLFPMLAHDEITGALVLPPQSTVTQSVRIDQGGLTGALWDRPSGSVDVFVTAMTNPMVTPDGMVVAGPCGVRRMFPRSLIRGGMPILGEPDRKRLREGLSGLPNQKMWTIDVMAAMVQAARGGDPETNLQRQAPDFFSMIERMENDRVPEVAAWASYTLLRLAAADTTDKTSDRKVEAEFKRLAGSQSAQGRLLAVWGSSLVRPDTRQVFLQPLLGDTDDKVKRAAQAEMDLAKKGVTFQPAATQPSSTPGPSGPATGPAVETPSDGPKLPLPGQ